jgi:hypothetical protein
MVRAGWRSFTIPALAIRPRTTIPPAVRVLLASPSVTRRLIDEFVSQPDPRRSTPSCSKS